MEDLTAFQRDALYVIAGLEEPKGLEIKDELSSHLRAIDSHGLAVRGA